MFFNRQYVTLAVLAISSSSVQSAPTCTNFTIPVAIQPIAVKVPLSLLPLNLVNFLGFIGNFAAATSTVVRSGTFDMTGTYCEPEVNIPARANTLQVLIHGVTYTKNYWFGLYKGDQYSWVATASKNGYPTVAIDRLGNGQSAHPDPVFDVQYPIQAQVIHQIIQKARNGQGPFPRTFSKIILAGHSYGSIISNAINFLYPADADATILTGFSAYILTAVAGAVTTAFPLPADVVEPARYSNLNPLYFEITSRDGANYLFYGPDGTFDQSVQDFNWVTRGTIAAGEAASAAFSTNIAHGYTGPVYLMTAEKDQIFCNLLGLPTDQLTGLVGFTVGGCTTSNVINYLEQSRPLYPDTSNFSYYSIPDAGHCWHLHYIAQSAFDNAHKWMADQGF